MSGGQTSVPTAPSALIQTREDLLPFVMAAGRFPWTRSGERGSAPATKHQVSWMRVPMTLAAVATMIGDGQRNNRTMVSRTSCSSRSRTAVLSR
ncbi:Uncharacterised protein [Mycobacteroides abscessus subsp. abscessus]|nr:Uncharacterised protein [Mycobacteroides abscessus subsp. abscessus]